jgi:two-component system NarL family sensor kinase
MKLPLFTIYCQSFFVLLFINMAAMANAGEQKDVLEILNKSFALRNINNDSALWYAEKGHQLAVASSNEFLIATAWARIGVANQNLGNWELAISNFMNALEKRKQLNDSVGVIRTYLDLGKCYYASGEVLINNGSAKHSDQFEAALEVFKKALGMAEKINHMHWISITHLNLGATYRIMERYAEAIGSYQASLKYGVDSTCVLNAEAKLGVACCYLDAGEKLTEAKQYLESAKVCFTKEGSLNNLGYANYNLAVVAYNQDEEQLALVHLAEAAAVFHQIKQLSWIVKIERFRYIIYEYLEDYESALAHNVRYKYLSDSLVNVKSLAALDEIKTKYETEKKENENLALKQENMVVEARNYLLLLFLGGFGVVILLLMALLWLRSQKRKREELIGQQRIERLIKEQEVKSLNALMEGQEKERQRIATDLHDRLGSMLSTIKMYFSSLTNKVDDVKLQQTNQYEKANHLLDDAIHEIRKISQNMVSGVLINFGLISAIKDLVDTIEGTEKIKVKFLHQNMEKRLNNDVEINIYRIVQEALSNVLKHSKATQVTVQLSRFGEHIDVMIEDDGNGFDTKRMKVTSGMGMGNIRSRVQKLNGKLTIDSFPGKGTTLNITDLKV